MSVKKDISALKNLFLTKNSSKNFSMYSKVYAFTTENISGYYSNLNFDNKKLLTICSSGDHVLNAILLGCNNIDCFDINVFTKYYMFLKVAAIKILSYEEFYEFFISNNKFSYYLYEKIRLFLDDEIKKFWDYIYDKYDSNQIYCKMFIKTEYIKTNMYYNLYLEEDNYNILKKRLLDEDINIKFFLSDILSIDKKIKQNYDYIFLSNIDSYLPRYYIDYENQNYIDYIKNNIIKNNYGSIVYISYIYNYQKKNVNSNIKYFCFKNMINVNQIDAVRIIGNDIINCNLE